MVPAVTVAVTVAVGGSSQAVVKSWSLMRRR